MPTKEELLQDIDFHYLKHFVYKTKVLHSGGNYFDKQDFVNGLSRRLKKVECEFLYDSFKSDRQPTEVADEFKYRFQPDEETVKAEFMEYISQKATEDAEAIFSELPLQGNRTDVNRFNGSSYTYELKSPRDSFRRLGDQISAYDEIFEYIYLVVPESTPLPDDLPTHLGVLRFNYPEFEFKEEKGASQIADYTPENQLNLLWIDELISLAGKEPPEESAEAKKEFLISRIKEQMTRTEINEAFKQTIKYRHLSTAG